MSATMTAAPPRRGAWGSYGALWAATPGRVVYLLAAFVLAMTAVGVLAPLFAAGVGLLILVIGLPLIVLALLVARGFSVADRFLLQLTALPQIAEPEWNQDAPGTGGFLRILTRPVRNAHYWLALVHGLVVAPIVATMSFALTVLWLSASLGGLTFWFWDGFIPRGDGGDWGHYVVASMPWVFGGWEPHAVESVLSLLAGILFAVTMPWVMSGLAQMHHAIARGMLGRWRSDDLAAEARAEALARGAAVHAEDVALRRLERDIHDGPQQRLVRLQMDLAALERRAAAGDTEVAAELARESRLHAKAALDELRALSSGVAPPLLQDRGLVAALNGAATASAVPVSTDLDPAIDTAVSPEIARAAYFIVAELLTNVAKHSRATAVALKAGVGRTADGRPVTLDVWVVDNGRGGALIAPGHGLEGLRDRLVGLRGRLDLESPLGGPTTAGVHIPLPDDAQSDGA